MQKPNKPCRCGANDWWLTPDGRYLCGRCHPNPNPGSSSSKEEYTPEVLALRDRVILGNKKLNAAWEQIKEIAYESEEWNYQMEHWHQANEKLALLCTELMVRGYTDCLYIENGKKMNMCLPGDDLGCRVCPSSRKYWEEELMRL